MAAMTSATKRIAPDPHSSDGSIPMRPRTSSCHDRPRTRNGGTSTTATPTSIHQPNRLTPRLGSDGMTLQIPADMALPSP
jgi:hypothetical protein